MAWGIINAHMYLPFMMYLVLGYFIIWYSYTPYYARVKTGNLIGQLPIHCVQLHSSPSASYHERAGKVRSI